MFKDAEKAVRRASSVHVSQTSHGTTDAEIVPGKGGTASYTEGGGARFQVVDTGDAYYILGNNAYWNSRAESKLRGRWLKCPPGSYMSRVGAPGFILYAAFGGEYGGTLRNAGETTYNGQRVVEIRGTDSEDVGAGEIKLYVAATGTPYPLAFVTKYGTLAFSDFNAPVRLTAPRDALSDQSLCETVSYEPH
ncbi:MAG TPA: hypothetical protein VGH79_01010 [Gaiellaceae bacterium]